MKFENSYQIEISNWI